MEGVGCTRWLNVPVRDFVETNKHVCFLPLRHFSRCLEPGRSDSLVLDVHFVSSPLPTSTFRVLPMP